MKSRLIRLGITALALLAGAVPALIESDDFREFVGDNPYWIIVGPVIVAGVQQVIAYVIQRSGKANPVSESPTA